MKYGFAHWINEWLMYRCNHIKYKADNIGISNTHRDTHRHTHTLDDVKCAENEKN